MAGVVRTERSEGFKIAEANLLLPPEDTFMKACRSSSAMRSTVGGAVCASVFSAVSPSLCFSEVAGNPRFFSRSVTALGEGSGLDGCFVFTMEPSSGVRFANMPEGTTIATANAKIAYRVCKQVIGTDWHRLHR